MNIKACPICNAEFTNGRRKYCSDECSRKANIQMSNAKCGVRSKNPASIGNTIECARCENLFVKMGRNQRYCSDKCRQATDMKPCEHCGKEMEAKTRRKRFCGKGCAAAHREGHRAHPHTHCHHCGDPIPQDQTEGRKRKYCSDRCRWDKAQGKPVRPPEMRAAIRAASPTGRLIPKPNLNKMPEITDEPISWGGLMDELKEAKGKPSSRKPYGYQLGDQGVSNRI